MSGHLSAEWWRVFILINLFFGDGIRDDQKSYVTSFIQEMTIDQESNAKNTKILYFALKGDQL